MDGLRQFIAQLVAGFRLIGDVIQSVRDTPPVFLILLAVAFLAFVGLLVLLLRASRRPPVDLRRLPPLPPLRRPPPAAGTGGTIHINQAVVFTDPSAARDWIRATSGRKPPR